MTFAPFLLAVTVQASIVLHLAAPPAIAFPMFDPVNETKWDPSWNPALLGGTVRQGLVFLTDDERGRATWLLDRYDPASYSLRYVVTAPQTLDQIDISLRPDGDTQSIATVTYTRTSLDPAADERVKHFGMHFPLQASHWESAINGVLSTH